MVENFDCDALRVSRRHYRGWTDRGSEPVAHPEPLPAAESELHGTRRHIPMGAVVCMRTWLLLVRSLRPLWRLWHH
jgi:hypothetical protein